MAGYFDIETNSTDKQVMRAQMDYERMKYLTEHQMQMSSSTMQYMQQQAVIQMMEFNKKSRNKKLLLLL